MQLHARSMIIAGSLLFSSIPWGASVAEDAVAGGVWQKHEYQFNFIGFTTTYSCDGLADKLKLLLLSAGARKDVKSQGSACASGFGRPDRFAKAYLTFYTLTAAGAEASSEAPLIRGTWRTVKFTPHSPNELGIGDCELIEQFRDHILPLFSVRSLNDNTTCVPHQESGSGFNLTFESFATVDAKPADRKGT